VPVYKKVNKDFFKKWTPEMAYVLGFFAADGTITVNPRGTQYFVFQIADKGLLESMRTSLGSEHKIGRRIHKKNYSVFYRLQIGSKEICDDLRSFGFGERKAKRMKLPKVPDKYFQHFLRGYFDGDGNVWAGFINRKREKPTKVLQTAFTSGSPDFLQKLHILLKNNGIIGGSLFKIKNKNCGRLLFSTLDALKLYEIMYNSPNKPTLYLKRKKLVFEKFIKMRA